LQKQGPKSSGAKKKPARAKKRARA
jgi:hypothetical protein